MKGYSGIGNTRSVVLVVGVIGGRRGVRRRKEVEEGGGGRGEN